MAIDRKLCPGKQSKEKAAPAPHVEDGGARLDKRNQSLERTDPNAPMRHLPFQPWPIGVETLCETGELLLHGRLYRGYPKSRECENAD